MVAVEVLDCVGVFRARSGDEPEGAANGIHRELTGGRLSFEYEPVDGELGPRPDDHPGIVDEAELDLPLAPGRNQVSHEDGILNFEGSGTGRGGRGHRKGLADGFGAEARPLRSRNQDGGCDRQ